MTGRLRFFQPSADIASVELPRETVSLGSGTGDWLRLPGAPAQAVLVAWNASAGTWEVSGGDGARNGDVRLNGAALSQTAALHHGDVLGLGDVALRVGVFPAMPMYNGAPCERIPLGPQQQQELVFGRDTGGAGPHHVHLDKDATLVSRTHLRLRASEGGYAAVDESRAGTLLNNRPFGGEQMLVAGDRLQIGPYTFEFGGAWIRLADPFVGARIEAAQISVQFGARKILEDINLSVAPCTFAGILGGSGHGKSTLLNALSGLVPLAGGWVEINGQAPGQATGLGYVPQEDIVHGELRVGEALEYSAQLRFDHSVPREALRTVARAAAARLGLEERWQQRISSLSGGQRKRVSIAVELLSKPSVLFLDEPSSGLDPATEYALMKLLRRLAEQDCTVICSTHVLGRAYLFDRLAFVRNGRIVYEGEPSGLTEHFGVPAIDDVYLAAEDITGLQASRDGVPGEKTDPGCDSAEAPKLRSAPPPEPMAAARKTRPGIGRTCLALVSRQARILAADRLNLAFLVAQPLVIGVLTGWVAEDAVLRTFLAVISVLWFGCSNGAQQIVRELSVLRRERLAGLGLGPYLASKFAFLSSVTALQAVLLLVTIGLVAPLWHGGASAHDFRMTFMVMSGLGPDQEPWDLGVWQGTALLLDAGASLDDDAPFGPRAGVAMAVALRLGGVLAAAVVGVAMGLAISALVQSTTQAVMWVPLVLIPQILFGGFVVVYPEMTPSVRAVAPFVPSFAAQRLMDIANVYGQARPLLTNTTKQPQYLSGRKEKVEWEAGREEFDEAARHNVSWQNLVTQADLAGQHEKAVKTSLRGLGTAVPPDVLSRVLEYNRVYRDTIEERHDVTMKRAQVYAQPDQALFPIVVAGVWVVVCFSAAFAALRRKT